MSLPTEQEINPEGNSYDGQTAVAHFLGKTREQIIKEIATRLHWYFYEDFYYLGPTAFCFYFPAVADYVTTPEAKADHDVVTNFCDVLESRLKTESIRECFPAVARFAGYVSAHLGEFGYGPAESETLRERLRAIERQCAGPGTPPNDAPSRRARDREAGGGPAAAS